MKREEYYSIDLFKFIFALVIVSIHTRLFESVSGVINWYWLNTICNLAVPFFFVTSGFLFYNRYIEGGGKQDIFNNTLKGSC